MQIAIVGPGGIGSTFAFQLSRAGHEVTVIARGKRLERLQRDRAIVNVAEERAAVRVSAALDATTEWDLVLVTVLANQVDAVLPALTASAAKTVMFILTPSSPSIVCVTQSGRRASPSASPRFWRAWRPAG